MKKLVVFILLAIPTLSFAQNSEKEINTQVWKPLLETYKNFDTEKFMSFHSKDLIRIPEDEKKIFGFSEYKKILARENQSNKNYKIKATMEMRFSQRIDEVNTAQEKGIYKLNIIKDNNGQTATLYGRFQIVLRKENGVWKILVDSDAAENNTTVEKEFKAAKGIE
jgi:ketosteroid isomerase-like protein